MHTTPGDLCIFRAPHPARERLPLLKAEVATRLEQIELTDQIDTVTVKSGDLIEIVAALKGTYRLARLPGLDGLLLIDAHHLTLYKAADVPTSDL